MQVLMKEKILESSFFSTKADSSVIRQALSVSKNSSSNSNGSNNSNNNKLSLPSEKNVTAKSNASKLVALVATAVSTNKEKDIESISVSTNNNNNNTNNVKMGVEDMYPASGDSNSPVSIKVDSLTSSTTNKLSKKSNLKKITQKLDILEKDAADIVIVNQTQTDSNNNNANTVSSQVQVYFEDDINNNGYSGDDANDLNENQSKASTKMISISQNVKHAGSKSSKVSSNKALPQQQQTSKSSKPKKIKKKEKSQSGTENNVQSINNDLDVYMQGKTLINSLVRSAINITNQYQSQVKPTENQYSPQNSDLVSNSSSNLKMIANDSPAKKVDKVKEKEKKKKSKKSRKKKKFSSLENINIINDNPTDQQIINIEEIESNEASLNLKEIERPNYSQTFSLSSKRNASPKRFTNTNIFQLPSQNDNQLNISTNESLRWQNQLNNIDEEQKRIEMYKMNRRKRYIDQRNIQLLAALSKAKTVLSAINTPSNVKIEDLTLENPHNNSTTTINTNHERPSSKLTARSNQIKSHLIIEDFLNSSATASKLNLSENTFRPISSRRKLSNYNNINVSNDTTLEYMELNSISTNMASGSLLPSRPKSEKTFRSSSFILSNNSNKRPLIGGETIISSITSNS